MAEPERAHRLVTQVRREVAAVPSAGPVPPGTPEGAKPAAVRRR